jgi:C2H2 transcription facotor
LVRGLKTGGTAPKVQVYRSHQYNHNEMDAQYAQQAMSQSAFFYYTPDPNPEARQHGHFTPTPQSKQMPVTSQPIAVYTPDMRPSSSCSQSSFVARRPYVSQNLLTPMASPQPMYQKPTILVQQESPYLHPLDTECSDMRFAPSTPPLSSSGSNISSPPSTCDLLPTPASSAFFPGETLEGVKQGCEEDVLSEILSAEWPRSDTPPMTPGKFQASHVW